MYYITGDCHGGFTHIAEFCEKQGTSKEDVMIVLGDAGVNYYGNHRDVHLKEKLQKLPITFFFVHGNHENRPQNIFTYSRREWRCGEVYAEEAYPNLLFAIDGFLYDINNKACLVIGGAYSVDKERRLAVGHNWWPDEQPSDRVKAYVEGAIESAKRLDVKIDCIFSHTCPCKYEPVEAFLSCVDQASVDKTTELWLDKIEETVSYEKWYCGHYHINKVIDRMVFLFQDIKEFVF